MVRVDPVVGVLLHVMEGAGQERFTVRRVYRCSISGALDRRAARSSAASKTAYRPGVTLVGQHHVDDLAQVVGSSLAVLVGTLILVTTAVQPWYAVTATGIGCLVDQPLWALLAIAGEPYYATVILDDAHQVLVGCLSYGWQRSRSSASLCSATGTARPTSGP